MNKVIFDQVEVKVVLKKQNPEVLNEHPLTTASGNEVRPNRGKWPLQLPPFLTSHSLLNPLASVFLQPHACYMEASGSQI